MKYDITPEMIEEIRKKTPLEIAKAIVEIQPINHPILMENLLAVAKSDKELQEGGYKPVSRMGLLWIKPD
jgi:hypothetical protein